jgi:hypothetical protein
MEISPTYINKFKVEKPPKGEARTYRENLLDNFLLKINQSREGTKYPPYTYPRLAKLLKGKNEVQLKVLYEDCLADHIPFTALFFSKIKKH